MVSEEISKNIEIVIVDDDPMIVSFLANAVSSVETPFALNMRTTGGAEEVLAFCAQYPADIILIDIMLSGALNGIDLTRLIKQHYPDTLAILITGYANPEFIIEALRNSAFDFLEKPVELERLKFSVKRAIDFACARRVTREQEEALRHSEETYAHLYQNMPTGHALFAVTGDGQNLVLKDANQAAEVIEGFIRGAVIDKSVTDIFPGKRGESLRRMLLKVHQQRKAEHLVNVAVGDQSSKRWVDLWIYPLPTGEIALLFEDVTSRQLTEEDRSRMHKQLMVSARLAALGNLSATIAKELAKPLSALEDWLRQPAKGQAALKPSASPSALLERMKTSLQQVISIAGNDAAASWENVNINNVLHQTLGSFERRLSEEGINVSTEQDFAIKDIYCCATDVQNLWQNLIWNAMESFEGVPSSRGKRILIKTRRLPTGIGIGIEDNGNGRAQALMQQLLGSFYAIKESGSSAGMGLWAIQGIVERNRGTSTVTSEPDHGSRYEIVLPLSEDPALLIPAGKAAHEPLPKRPQMIIIDDDEMVCDFLTCFLGKQFDVISFSSPVLGVAHMRSHTYDMLVVDLAMPDLNGIEITHISKKLHPQAKVVIATGYTREAEMLREALGCGADDILYKPFDDMDEINRKLWTILH